jgi:hypothetical protein
MITENRLMYYVSIICCWRTIENLYLIQPSESFQLATIFAAAGVLCAVAGAMMMMNHCNNCRTLWVWATYTAAAAGCPILSKKCVGVVWSKKKKPQVLAFVTRPIYMLY